MAGTHHAERVARAASHPVRAASHPVRAASAPTSGARIPTIQSVPSGSHTMQSAPVSTGVDRPNLGHSEAPAPLVHEWTKQIGPIHQNLLEDGGKDSLWVRKTGKITPYRRALDSLKSAAGEPNHRNRLAHLHMAANGFRIWQNKYSNPKKNQERRAAIEEAQSQVEDMIGAFSSLGGERWQDLHEKLLVDGGSKQTAGSTTPLSEPDSEYNKIINHMDASQHWTGDDIGGDEIAHADHVSKINKHIHKINAWHKARGKPNNRAAALSSLQKGLKGELPNLLQGMKDKHNYRSDDLEDRGTHLRTHIGLLDAQIHGREASKAFQKSYRSGAMNSTRLTNYQDSPGKEWVTKAETPGLSMQVARFMGIPEGTADLVSNPYLYRNDDAPELARRNVGVYRGAKAFGLGHVIAETHFAREKEGLGIAMAKAPGMAPNDAWVKQQFDKIDFGHSKNQRDLLALQAYDYVSQAGNDRHGGNYLVAPSTRETHGGEVVETGGGVKGIDNDASWGTNAEHHESGAADSFRGKTGSHSMGLPPRLHKEDAAKITQMTEEKLEAHLGLTVRPGEFRVACLRLRQLQNHIGQLHKKGHILEDKHFGRQLYDQLANPDSDSFGGLRHSNATTKKGRNRAAVSAANYNLYRSPNGPKWNSYIGRDGFNLEQARKRSKDS